MHWNEILTHGKSFNWMHLEVGKSAYHGEQFKFFSPYLGWNTTENIEERKKNKTKQEGGPSFAYKRNYSFVCICPGVLSVPLWNREMSVFSKAFQSLLLSLHLGSHLCHPPKLPLSKLSPFVLRHQFLSWYWLFSKIYNCNLIPPIIFFKSIYS